MKGSDDVPTALVFGKSGVGKSYLCNYLLYGSGRAEEGFDTGKGRKPIASECQAKTVERTEPLEDSLEPGGPLKMIDTPGIPDPAGSTAEFYDQIVQTAREAGGLNAFIMVLNDNNDREHIEKDSETYRDLLTWSAKLPVAKVVVCRVRPNLDASEEERKEDLEETREWVTNILDKAGLKESAHQVYIMEDDTMKLQYSKLRRLVIDMQWVPVGHWNIKTPAELMQSAEPLHDGSGTNERSPAASTDVHGNVVSSLARHPAVSSINAAQTAPLPSPVNIDADNCPLKMKRSLQSDKGTDQFGCTVGNNPPTALVFGKSGVGKSYLCNYLLYGSGRAEEGFDTGKGRKPIASECQAKTVERTEPPEDSLEAGGPLKMIDTPGIPDPAGSTAEVYDQIVRTVREAGGLNAFIMVLNYASDREHIDKDLETYRDLLTQFFGKLRVAKVVVCRVRPDPDATEEERDEDLEETREWVTDILDNIGMESAHQVYIMEDDTVKLQYYMLRRHVTDMSWVPVGDWNIKTFAELKQSTEHLMHADSSTDEREPKNHSLESGEEKTHQVDGKVPNTLPTALVFGKSGVGKSYLCNYLLYGSGQVEEGFDTGKGRKPIASECQAKTVKRMEPPEDSLEPGGPLQVINTPGIPDPAGSTAVFYDQIVQTAREAGGLNAFIMVLNYASDGEQMEKDLQTYRNLLTRFTKLPVFKVLVFRVRPGLDASEEERKQGVKAKQEWVTGILDKAGMKESAHQLYIVEDDTMKVQYYMLRRLVTGMPWVPIRDWNIKTPAELRQGAERLHDGDTRTKELKMKKRSLQSVTKELDGCIAKLESKIEEAGHASRVSYLVAGAAGATALSGFGILWAFGAGFAYFGFHRQNEQNIHHQQIRANEARKRDIEDEIDDIDRELTSGEGSGHGGNVLAELERPAT